MEKICKKCKFWKRMIKMKLPPELVKSLKLFITKEKNIYSANKKVTRIEVFIPDSPIGKCGNKNFIYTAAGGCQEDDLINALTNPRALLYSDSEAYQAYFLTGEKFGCIHFENK